MTLKEYSTLMGYTEDCTFEEYKAANFIYMMAGEMDKQTFCTEYKKMKDSPLIRTLAETANKHEMDSRKYRGRSEEMAHILLRQASQVRKGLVAKDALADSIDGAAEQLIGKKQYLKYKLDNKLPLSDYDLQTLKELI